MDTCSHCGAELPANASFCPSCGRRADAELEGPIEVQHAQPRHFGLGQPVFLLAVGLALLVLGVVLLVEDVFALGVISIVLAVCLLPAFLAGARRWPESRVARLGINTADRVRDETDVAVESISTWSRAGRDVVRLRREQFALRRQRDAKIRELGVSFYADDGRAEELKREAKELDERIAANDRQLERTVTGAKRRVRKERAAVAPTQVLSPTAERETESSDGFDEDATAGPARQGRAADPADDEADVVELDRRS